LRSNRVDVDRPRVPVGFKRDSIGLPARRKALLLRDDLLVGRHAEHIWPLHRQAELAELIHHFHFLFIESRSPHRVTGQMRRGVVDAAVVLVSWHAESPRSLQRHGLVQVLIDETHLLSIEPRRSRRFPGLVQLEMLEIQGRRGLSDFRGGNAQLGPSPLHAQLVLAERIRRDHLGIDQ